MHQAALEWHPGLSVGIQEIDEQHRILLRGIARLAAELQGNGLASRELVSNLLGDLTDYVRYHFQCEEDFMRRRGYADLVRHTAEHRYFAERSVDLCTLAMLTPDEAPRVILDYLQEWVLHHIQHEDARLRVDAVDRKPAETIFADALDMACLI